jgi:DNA adenine methylase
MYYHAKDIWNGRVDANDIEKAWAIWLITNGSYAGSMHGGWKWCNGTTGGHTGTFIKRKREEFTERLHQRLDNVQISCRDALRVIQDRDTPETLFYLELSGNRSEFENYKFRSWYQKEGNFVPDGSYYL